MTIQITREGTVPEQPAALIKGASDLLLDVLNKPRRLTFVAIQEVEMEDRGVGGLPVKECRKLAEAKSTGVQVGRCRFYPAPKECGQHGPDR